MCSLILILTFPECLFSELVVENWGNVWRILLHIRNIPAHQHTIMLLGKKKNKREKHKLSSGLKTDITIYVLLAAPQTNLANYLHLA